MPYSLFLGRSASKRRSERAGEAGHQALLENYVLPKALSIVVVYRPHCCLPRKAMTAMSADKELVALFQELVHIEQGWPAEARFGRLAVAPRGAGLIGGLCCPDVPADGATRAICRWRPAEIAPSR